MVPIVYAWLLKHTNLFNRLFVFICYCVKILNSHVQELGTLAVDDGGSTLIVFGLGDPHVFKC